MISDHCCVHYICLFHPAWARVGINTGRGQSAALTSTKTRSKRKNKFWKTYLHELSKFKKICTYCGLEGDWELKLDYLVSNQKACLSFWAGHWFGRRFWVKRTYQSCCSGPMMVADAVCQARSRTAEMMSLSWHYSLYFCLGGVLPLEGVRWGKKGAQGLWWYRLSWRVCSSGRLMATEQPWEPTPASS